MNHATFKFSEADCALIVKGLMLLDLAIDADGVPDGIPDQFAPRFTRIGTLTLARRIADYWTEHYSAN